MANCMTMLSEPFSHWGEGAPQGRMRGPSLAHKIVAPHQFGQMTYGCAAMGPLAVGLEHATVSHGLTSSPPRGEAHFEGASCLARVEAMQS
jgi:hypothetical protein